MFDWLFGKGRKIGEVRRVSDILCSKAEEKRIDKEKIDLELAEPILVDFKYIATIRCGLGFDYKSYDVEVKLTEVTSIHPIIKCEICGGDVKLFTIVEAMSRPIMRMGYNSLNNSPNGNHAVYANIKIDKETVDNYNTNIEPKVFARMRKLSIYSNLL